MYVYKSRSSRDKQCELPLDLNFMIAENMYLQKLKSAWRYLIIINVLQNQASGCTRVLFLFTPWQKRLALKERLTMQTSKHLFDEIVA